jgi:peroxiredoxin
LQDASDRFAAAGADVVLIGQATPQDGQHFREQFSITVPLLVDHRRKSYRAVGARMAGVSGLFGPRMVLRAITTILGRRVRQGRTIGHPAQLGAALIAAPGDRVLYEQLARDASDNASSETLLAAL